MSRVFELVLVMIVSRVPFVVHAAVTDNSADAQQAGADLFRPDALVGNAEGGKAAVVGMEGVGGTETDTEIDHVVVNRKVSRVCC